MIFKGFLRLDGTISALSIQKFRALDCQHEIYSKAKNLKFLDLVSTYFFKFLLFFSLDREHEMTVALLPIKPSLEENTEFINLPECLETLEMSVLFYANVGYRLPWIGYYASLAGKLVGSAGFKGRPINGTVEIAYGTFPPSQNRGIGTAICRELVRLALAADPLVRIVARTLMEENYSTRILRKNGFTCMGIVTDPDDGDVWEWEYKANGLFVKPVGDE